MTPQSSTMAPASRSNQNMPSKQWQWLWGAAAIGLLSVAALLASPGAPSTPHPQVMGRTNTVLFITCELPGLSNVFVATAAALVERHPDIEVHVASFPKLAGRVARASEQALEARHRGSSVPKVMSNDGIIFHSLTSAPSFMEKMTGTYFSKIHAAGPAGLKTSLKTLQHFLTPWTGPEYLALFNEALHLIEHEINPAVVVLEPFMGPGREAARKLNRLHAFISPNQLVDNFLSNQPWGGALWRFPAIGSGHPFPVPWHLIPRNIYMNVHTIYAISQLPLARDFVDYVKHHDLPASALSFFGLYRDDSPWITQHVAEASTKPDFIPGNVTITGPIVLSSVPAEQQDPDLVAWLKKRRTVLINLGSTTLYDPARMTAMVGAIRELLASQPDLQVLWKYIIPSEGGAKIEDYISSVQKFVDDDRLRLSTWLSVDPAALLDTGYIVGSVHHGGANCYWETVQAGVPHVILPSWSDHYSFAQLVQQTGLGIYACRETSPAWTEDCISAALRQLTDGGPASRAMAEKAKRVGKIANKDGPGRNAAAATIAELAATGH